MGWDGGGGFSMFGDDIELGVLRWSRWQMKRHPSKDDLSVIYFSSTKLPRVV